MKLLRKLFKPSIKQKPIKQQFNSVYEMLDFNLQAGYYRLQWEW